MKLKNHGKSTSSAEVVQISLNGIWLFVKGIEYFLPFRNFPWFKDATVSQVHKVSLLNKTHLYWPELDVDLELDSLANLENYPLIYR